MHHTPTLDYDYDRHASFINTLLERDTDIIVGYTNRDTLAMISSKSKLK